MARISQNQASLQQFLSVPNGSQNPDAQPYAADRADGASRGRYGIGQPSCLKVSLALWWLLARQGIASDLRVGVHQGRAQI